MALRTVSEAMNGKALERKNQNQPTQKKQVQQIKKTAEAKKPNSNEKALSKAGGTKDMTETEARNAINTIKNSVCSLMETCYEFKTRNGYVALGYTSFKECVEIELVGVINYDYAIKMKNAGQVHMVVCPEIPMGEVSEGVLRPLHRLIDAKKKAVWKGAVRKCGGDFKEVTEPMITEIIEAKGLAAPREEDKNKTEVKENDPKDVLDTKIILKAGLQKKMRLTVLEMLQENATGNKHRPASKEYFEDALNIILDDLCDFLCDHYDDIYGE